MNVSGWQRAWTLLFLSMLLRWLGHTVTGDLGRSLVTGDPAQEEILLKLPATFQLALAALVVSLLVAVPAGYYFGSKAAFPLDYLTMTGALLGVSMPNFCLGLLLILFFAVKLGWFPVYGYGGLSHMILPAITLAPGWRPLPPGWRAPACSMF